MNTENNLEAEIQAGIAHAEQKAEQDPTVLHDLVEKTSDPEKLEQISKALQTRNVVSARKIVEKLKEKVEKNQDPEVEKKLNEKLAIFNSRVEELDQMMQANPESPVEAKPTAKTESKRLKDDLGTAKNQAIELVEKTQKGFQDSILKPLATRMKDTFIIGPLMGYLANMSTEQVKIFVERQWYQLVAAPEALFGADAQTGWMSRMFSGMADNAKKQLAILDARQAISDAKDDPEAPQGETIDANPKYTMDTEQWKEIKKLIQGNPKIVEERVTMHIEKARKNGSKDIKINLTEILLSETVTQEPVLTSVQTELKKRMREKGTISENQKIKFAVGEASIEGDTLTLDESDINAEGTMKIGSKAERILEAAPTVKSEQFKRIVISDKGGTSIDLSTETLTISTKTSSETLKKLFAIPRKKINGRVSVLEYSSDPKMAINKPIVRLSFDNDRGILALNKYPETLTICQNEAAWESLQNTIAGAEISTNTTSREWTTQDKTTWIPVSKDMPITPKES